MRAGQINLEFLGSSLLFFTALVFIINVAFDTLPQYSRSNQIDEMHLNMFSLSEALNMEGFWIDGAINGTDWENHASEVVSLGFLTNETFDFNKLEAFENLPYEDTKTKFQIPDNFWMEFEEFVPIDTYPEIRSSEWDDFFSFGEHPDFNEKVFHHGEWNGTHFFLPIGDVVFNHLYVYRDGFYDEFDLSEDNSLELSGLTYEVGTDVGWASQGRVVILKRDILTYGREEPGIAKNTISGSFYMPTKYGSIVKMTLFLWRR